MGNTKKNSINRNDLTKKESLKKYLIETNTQNGINQ